MEEILILEVLIEAGAKGISDEVIVEKLVRSVECTIIMLIGVSTGMMKGI